MCNLFFYFSSPSLLPYSYTLFLLGMFFAPRRSWVCNNTFLFNVFWTSFQNNSFTQDCVALLQRFFCNFSLQLLKISPIFPSMFCHSFLCHQLLATFLRQ
jgi:hypothetical protein